VTRRDVFFLTVPYTRKYSDAGLRIPITARRGCFRHATQKEHEHKTNSSRVFGEDFPQMSI